MIFIAGIKDECTDMVPCQTLAAIAEAIGGGVHYSAFPLLVLRHHSIDLLLRTCHVLTVVAYRHAQLLMAVIDVDICVCGDGQTQGHDFFQHHETYLGSRLSLLVNNTQTVVAAELQLCQFVGYGQTIVNIRDGRID